jgi:hypothetical protein
MENQGAVLRKLLFPDKPESYVVTPQEVQERIPKYLDKPVRSDGQTVTLRKVQSDDPTATPEYYVEVATD